jgi:hypothetical protein
MTSSQEVAAETAGLLRTQSTRVNRDREEVGCWSKMS